MGTLSANSVHKEDIKALQDVIDGANTTINNAINDLKARVSALESKLQTALGDITVNESEIIKLIQQLSDLSAKIDAEDKALYDIISGVEDTISSAVEALSQRVTTLEQKLQNAIGDITVNESEIVRLVKQLSDVSAQINTLTDVYATQTSLKALESTVNNANNAINQTLTELQSRVEALDSTLNQAINTANRNTQSITELSSSLLDMTDRLDSLASTYIDLQSFEQLKKSLTAADNTLELAVEVLKEDLNRMRKELQDTISSKADAKAVAAKFAEIQATIDNANESSILGVGGLRSEFQAADATLNQAIQAVNVELGKAKKDLEVAIATKADAETINKKIEQLNKAIENAVALADTANNDLRTELKGEIATAKQQAIRASEEYAAQIKTELEQKLSELSALVEQNGNTQSANKNELTEQIKKAQLLPIIIASVSIIANIALATWLMLIKKKIRA